MDRYKLEQLRDKVGELLRDGTSSCIRQANGLMVENFETVLYFALDLTNPKVKPKHTIADNYPAGGLTQSEPCMFCVDYEKLQTLLEFKSSQIKDFVADVCTAVSESNKLQAELQEQTQILMALKETIFKELAISRQLQTELEQYRWIPISERLPKIEGEAMQSKWVRVTDGKKVVDAYYFDYTQRKVEKGYAIGKGWYVHGMRQTNITHFQEITLPCNNE